MGTESRKAQMQAAVVRLAQTEYGSHDTAKLARVLRLLLDQAEKPDPPYLVVDLSKVHYFGARFIAILVSTWNQLGKRNRRLALCGLTPFCTALIQNLQLHRLFDIYPTQRIALEEIERHVQSSNEETRTTGVRVPKSQRARNPDRAQREHTGSDGVPRISVATIRPQSERLTASIVASASGSMPYCKITSRRSVDPVTGRSTY